MKRKLGCGLLGVIGLVGLVTLMSTHPAAELPPTPDELPTVFVRQATEPVVLPNPTRPGSATATLRPVDTPSPTAIPVTYTPTLPAPVVLRSANLRAGPGTNYRVAGAARAGDKLEIVARSPAGDWFKLASGLWIAGQLIGNRPTVPEALLIPASPAPIVIVRATAKPKATAPPVRAIAPQPSPAPAKSCCKVCTKGKPCGDTCIRQDAICDKGPGCACQG